MKINCKHCHKKTTPIYPFLDKRFCNTKCEFNFKQKVKNEKKRTQ